MSTSKKIERALYGPSWTEVLLGAALSIVLGVALGATHLVLKPVKSVRELPKEIAANTVYFIEGSKDSSKGRGWLLKRQAILQAQAVDLTEEELNTAIATPTEKPKADAAPAAPAADAMLSPGALNFRIAEGQLQMAIPVKISLLDTTLIVQAKGSFEHKGDGFRFVPSQFYVGSCPVQRLPIVQGLLLKRLYEGMKAPEDLSAAWAKLSEMNLAGRVLKLNF
jgi:hypothetical protein